MPLTRAIRAQPNGHTGAQQITSDQQNYVRQRKEAAHLEQLSSPMRASYLKSLYNRNRKYVNG